MRTLVIHEAINAQRRKNQELIATEANVDVIQL